MLRRVTGGTPALVDGLVKRLEIRVRVVAVTPGMGDAAGVTVRTANESVNTFDRVLIATQANDVAGFLDASLERERAVLGRFRHDSGALVVHREARFMPPRRGESILVLRLLCRRGGAAARIGGPVGGQGDGPPRRDGALAFCLKRAVSARGTGTPPS